MNVFSAIDGARAVRVIAVLAGVAALYFARDLLIPAALAVLLTFLLYPLVRRLERVGINHIAAVSISVAVLVLLTAGIGLLVFRQAIDLTAKLPDYRDNLKQRIRDIRSSGTGTLSKVTGTIKELQEELTTTQPTTDASTAENDDGDDGVARNQAPAPAAGPGVADTAASWLGSLLFPITQAGIILLLLVFLLLQSDDVRERLIWLAGTRQMSVTISAIDEMGRRISRYLRMQLVINLTYGAIVGAGLYIIGVPNAVLWGVLGAMLRFVPFVGPWLAAIMPTLLALAVFPDWMRPLLVVAMFIVAETFTNMVMEPWLYGSSAGISTLGVVVAAVFWGWIWGAVGLVLAVPITVCLVVLGKHVPNFSIFHQLLGSEGAIPQSARLYQRLLVGDEDSVEDIIEDCRCTAEGGSVPFAQLCDDLLLPVLHELKRDLSVGLVTAGHAKQALQALELICRPEPASAAVVQAKSRLLCVPAQNEVDEAAAQLLVRAAQAESIPAEALSEHTLTSEVAAHVEESSASTICIVQVPPATMSHARHLVKTLHTRVGSEVQLIELTTEEHPSPNTDRSATTGTARRPPVITEASQATLRRERTFTRLLETLGDLRMPAEPMNASAPPPSKTEPALS
jgi:predicted PurR-regulated permease PerM